MTITNKPSLYLQADTDEDDMDIDRSDSDGDQHSDDLNQEEIEDVERNCKCSW